MRRKNVPIGLIDAIARFTATNGGEVERTMDKCVFVGQIDPFPKRHKTMASCVGGRRVRWSDQMSFRG